MPCHISASLPLFKDGEALRKQVNLGKVKHLKRKKKASTVLTPSSILFKSSTFPSRITSMAPEPKGAPSRLLPRGLIIDAPDNTEVRLSTISGKEVTISHVERLRKRPCDSLSFFTRSRSADRGPAWRPKVPPSRNQMFSSRDRLSTKGDQAEQKSCKVVS